MAGLLSTNTNTPFLPTPITHTAPAPKEGQPKLIRCEPPRRADTRGLFWDMGVMYEEEGTDKRQWFCLAHAECRDAQVPVLCSSKVTSKCTDHLRIEHGEVSTRSREMAHAKDQAATAAAAADSELKVMTNLGLADRFHQLMFIITFVVGEFEPFIFGEKRRVRQWLRMNGRWFVVGWID